MSKAESNANDWLTRSARFSTRGGRNGANLLGWGLPEDVSIHQERDHLRQRARVLSDTLSDRTIPEPRRSELAEEIHRVNLRLAEIKKELGDGYEKRDLSNYIVDILKEEMPRPAFARLVSRARERMEQEG